MFYSWRYKEYVVHMYSRIQFSNLKRSKIVQYVTIQMNIENIMLSESSVVQSCWILCEPMDYSMPGSPVHHQLLDPTKTHVHCISDATQPSHPLSSPYPPAFNLSQHQGLFKWVNSSHQWPKYWSFTFSISPSNEYSRLISLRWTGWTSLQSKGHSRVSSSTTIQKHQFFGAQRSL